MKKYITFEEACTIIQNSFAVHVEGPGISDEIIRPDVRLEDRENVIDLLPIHDDRKLIFESEYSVFISHENKLVFEPKEPGDERFDWNFELTPLVPKEFT